MRQYIDAILHLPDLPGFVTMMQALSPDRVQDGAVTGFDRTPMVILGAEALVYVRMTVDEAAQWRGTPGVTILADAPYDGEATGDAVYAALAADPEAQAVYDRVYPRTPVTWLDDAGVEQVHTPPERFGVIG